MHDILGVGTIAASIYITSALADCAVFFIGQIPLDTDCEFSGFLYSLSLQRRM